MIFTRELHQPLYYLTLLYALTLPLSRAAIVFFSILLILLWLIQKKPKESYQRVFSNRVIIALVSFLLYNLLSLFWSDDIINGFDYILKYWYFLPMIVIFTTIKKSQIPSVLSAFLIGMFISETISYGVFFELWTFKRATVENISPFMHHIEYSIFLALTALIILERILSNPSIKTKLFYGLFFLTVTGNLFLTAGRTGQLAFILGILILALTSIKNRLKAITLFTLLSTSLLVSAFYLSNTFNQRITDAKDNFIHAVVNQYYCTSLGARIGAWIIATDIIKEHPIVGVGIVDNMTRFHEIIDEKYPEMKCLHVAFMHMHNQFFQIATQLGILGLTLFLWIFYEILRLPIASKPYRHLKYFYIAMLLFAFLPEVLLHRQFSMALFALIAGILLAQSKEADDAL
jgi:O-antigen ligase